VGTVFTANGFAFASWVTRIPTVRDALGLDASRLGLLLLVLAVGSVASLPLAGAVVTRFGAAATVRWCGLLVAAGLVVVGAGAAVAVWVVALGLLVMSLGIGLWDVAMNVHGARVESELRRSLLPRLHAGFSLGTVLGALLGTGLIGLGVPLLAHLGGVAVVVAGAVLAATARFLPREPAADGDDAPGSGALRAWTEPRTLVLGVFVLAMAFAEGTGNDWLAVATIDGFGVPAAGGTLAFAAFVVAMTAGRLAGPVLLDRWRRVPVLRACAAAALVGVLLVAFGGAYWLALVGALVWGAGTALGFPVGMSAASDDPARAAARVSVVSSIGYCAFLAGPPLIGLLGDAVGTQRAVAAAAVLLVVALLTGGALEEPGS
jgi:fucose permease